MSPADLAERLQVFLTEAVGLSRRTALTRLLLSPLALWEHRAHMCMNIDMHLTFTTAMLPRFNSTPVLLQGGDVGQQAFVVELLQLQELDGPLVWFGWQLKTPTQHHSKNLSSMSIRAAHFLPEDTNTPNILTGRQTHSGCQSNGKNTTGGNHTAGSPRGFEPKYGQHPETGNNNTGRYV